MRALFCLDEMDVILSITHVMCQAVFVGLCFAIDVCHLVSYEEMLFINFQCLHFYEMML
jgi:hypothetical protein